MKENERKSLIDATVREMMPWHDIRYSSSLLKAIAEKLPDLDINLEDLDRSMCRVNAAWWNNAWRLDRPKNH